eukprot:scaffold6103_cov116-Cylindrotheca_fusiformis.AAC.10
MLSWHRRLGLLLLLLVVCANICCCHAGNNKRVVVFVGPFQTNNEDLFELLTRYCTGLKFYAKKKAFQNWRWPTIDTSDKKKKKKLAPQQYLSVLVSNKPEDVEIISEIESSIQEYYRGEKNLVFGSDQFGHFGTAPWSGKNGVQTLKRLETILEDVSMEIVVNYRAPRLRHWYSLWEKSSSTLEYSKWICTEEYDKLWETLDAAANPLGLAQAVLSTLSPSASVKLVDQMGAHQEDLYHRLPCDILDVTCQKENTVIQGIDPLNVYKSKPRPTDDVSKRQAKELEWVFQQRDCLYQKSFQKYENFEVLYRESLWNRCNSTDLIPELLNTTYMLDLLRSQFQCAQDQSISLAKLSQDHHAVAPKRVVVFAGPHKSASSTIQEFLIQYCTGRRLYQHHRAFDDWRWPSVEGINSKVPDRKILSRLVYNETKDEALIRAIKAAIARTYRSYSNMVLGSEELDRFGAVPWSGRNGIKVVQDLEKLLNHPHLEIVLNYRTPRQKQWVSIWKQLSILDVAVEGKADSTYSEWICTDHKRAWEYLDCVANPLGLAEAFLTSLSPLATVKLIDMGGVSKQNLDISHASACSILNVPCNNGTWVAGLEGRALMVNQKKKPKKDISSIVAREMRWVLNQRDCLYQASLEAHSNFEVLYRDSLWEDCSDSNLLPELSNTTFLLELLKSQFGCASDPALNLTTFIEQHATAATAALFKESEVDQSERRAQSSPTIADELGTPPIEIFGTGLTKQSVPDLSDFHATITDKLDDHHSEDWRLIQGIQWAMVIGLFASFLVRKQKARRLRRV